MKSLFIAMVSIVLMSSCAGLQTAMNSSQQFISDVERVSNFTNSIKRSTFKSTTNRRPIYKVNETVSPRNWSINTNQTGGTTIPMCPGGTRPNGN